MTFHDLAIATHLVGVILWIGTMVGAAIIAAGAANQPEETRKAMLGAVRRVLLAISAPAMLIAFAAGLSFLVPNFTTLYAHAGWMHAKLTLVLIMAALHGVLTARVRKGSKGAPVSSGLLSGLAVAIVLGAAAVVFLAILRPGHS